MLPQRPVRGIAPSFSASITVAREGRPAADDLVPRVESDLSR